MEGLRIAEYLYLDETAQKGRGVYTSKAIKAGTIVERSAVLVLDEEERAHLENTILYDYIFEWGDESVQCCVAWGYISMYNHQYTSNCEYEMDFEERTILIRAILDIEAGEELTVNYNGDDTWDTPVWFDTKD